MKPVFLIAIVAVAMIGVMVPSVFATHDNDVGLLLPANWDLENYWTIEDIRGDRSYTSSGAYIEGFEKSYDRIDGYSFVGLSAAIYEVTEDVQDNWTAQDIASDERERYFGNGKMQAPIAFSDFKPFGFPSECKAIKIEYGDIYGNVKINSYCVKDQYHFSVIALGNVWDIDNDVIDFTKIILTNIDEHYSVVPTPSSQENSSAAIATTSTNVTVADESTYSVNMAMGSGSPGCETSNACYLPADITISTGNTVQWNNVDTAAHTVSGGSPAEGPSGVFDSGIIMAGSSYSHTFDDAGNYDYFCVLHPWMDGVIVVGEKQYFPSDEPTHTSEPEPLGISSFVDQTKDPQHYIDRYNNEPKYKQWFDDNYSQYSSIYEAVGLEEPIIEQINEPEYVPEPGYTPESTSPKSDLNKAPISKEIFERKKTDVISSILFDPGFSYHFSLEKDFTSELGLTESYYQLYKIIDNKTTKRIGDLRIYLGSSEWWDHNASLQENDTSGFNNIFKVKFFIMHKGDSEVAQQISNNLSSALRVLVPEWSNEIGSTSNTWLIDSINYSERNDQSKRENSIMTQKKEIKILHDDLDWGTITLIVTENADTIKIPNVSTDTEILDQLLDEPTTTTTSESKGGGCLIATATYGSEMANEVQQLRELRDHQLLQTESGAAFMGTFNDIYYSFSPIIADYERENPYFKEVVKIAITPMITSLSLMENVESESEVLGLGLSVIALNLGMYLGVPAIVVVGIRRKF